MDGRSERSQRSFLLAAKGGPSVLDRRFLHLISGGVFMDSVVMSAVAPVLPFLARSLRLSPHLPPLLLATRSFVAVAAALPLGILLLVTSASEMLMSTFAMSALGSACLAFPLAWWILAAAMIFQGLAFQSMRSSSLFFTSRLLSSGASLEEMINEIASHGMGLQRIFRSSSAFLPFRPDGTYQRVGNVKGGDQGQSRGREKKNVLFVVRGATSVFESRVEEDAEIEKGGLLEGDAALIAEMGSILGWASIGSLVGPLFASLAFQYAATWLAFSVACTISTCLLLAASVVKPEADMGPTLSSPSFVPGGNSGRVDLAEVVQDSGGHGIKSDGQDLTRPFEGMVVDFPLSPRPARASLPNTLHPLATPPPLLSPHSHSRTHPSSMSLSWGQGSSLIDFVLLVLRTRAAVVVLFGTALQMMSFGALEAILPFFLADECRANTAVVGAAFAMNALAYSLVAWGAQRVVHHIKPSGAAFLGLALLAISLPLLVVPSFSCSTSFQFFMIAVNGMGYAFVEFPSFPSLVTAMVSESGFTDVAILVALYNLVSVQGYAAGPVFVSLFKNTLSPCAIMGCISGALSVAACFGLWIRWYE